MSYTNTYLPQEPTREVIDASRGALVLEFGAPWCGFCQAAQHGIATALAAHPGIVHYKIEDGRGRRLGRSYRIKLWPTLVFLRDGEERARLVRPETTQDIGQALATIADNASQS
jgi:thioredoxin 1